MVALTKAPDARAPALRASNKSPKIAAPTKTIPRKAIEDSTIWLLTVVRIAPANVRDQ